jgi:hypothetical protein
MGARVALDERKRNAEAKACGPGVKAVFLGKNAYPQSQGTAKGTVSSIDTAETY